MSVRLVNGNKEVIKYNKFLCSYREIRQGKIEGPNCTEAKYYKHWLKKHTQEKDKILWITLGKNEKLKEWYIKPGARKNYKFAVVLNNNSDAILFVFLGSGEKVLYPFNSHKYNKTFSTSACPMFKHLLTSPSNFNRHRGYYYLVIDLPDFNKVLTTNGYRDMTGICLYTDNRVFLDEGRIWNKPYYYCITFKYGPELTYYYIYKGIDVHKNIFLPSQRWSIHEAYRKILNN